MDTLVALCQGRGFVYAGSEIYGGLPSCLSHEAFPRGFPTGLSHVHTW